MTRAIRKSGLEHFAWQRNYYEHIVQNDGSLERIRRYIVSNPLYWHSDAVNTRRLEGSVDELEVFLELNAG